MQNLFGIPELEPESCVYLMQYSDEPIYKIGYTKKLSERLILVQVEVPHPVEVIHEIWSDSPRWLETYWHRRFASKRRKGSARKLSSEWFNLTSDDVSEFKSHFRIDREHENKLYPVLPVVFATVQRQAAENRVTARYDYLISQHPRKASKLANACKWQLNVKLNDMLNGIKSGKEEKEVIKQWEDGAYSSAEAKIKE